MQAYLMRRILLFIPTIFISSVIIFVVMRVLPGDVAQLILSDEETGEGPESMELVDTIRDELGLNDPIPIQYGRWIWTFVNGEFGGRSLWNREPLSQIIGRRLPVTLQLTVYTALIGWAFAIPLGVLAAIHQNRWPDYVIRVGTVLGHTLPNFWIALMLILGLLIYFRWTPPLFYEHVWDNPSVHFQKVIWPVMVLAWSFSSTLTRVTRSNMLEVLRQDYVRTARSKGLAERVIIFRHALRNALLPVITIGGLQLGAFLSGTVILESIFGLPGIGQGVVLAANERDYPVIQSLVLLLVFMQLALNLIVDISYVFADPRVSYAKAK